MKELEILDNITTFDEFVAHIEKTGRQVNDFLCSHLHVESKGHAPHIIEHDFFLNFGADFYDNRRWKSIVYHIPSFAQGQEYDNFSQLSQKYDSYSYYEQGLRRKWIAHIMIVGRQQDERGFALIDAEIGEKGRINKATHFHGYPFVKRET